jgi:hypothetical protein
MSDGESAAAQLDALIRSTVAELESRGIPDEALAVEKVGGLRARRMVKVGRAWRLGALLIAREGLVYSTGEVTRAIEPSIASRSRTVMAEQQRDDRRAAARGRFREGEVINFRFTAIATDAAALAEGTGPLSLRDGVLMMQWNPDAANGRRPLAQYLRDRLAVLDED